MRQEYPDSIYRTKTTKVSRFQKALQNPLSIQRELNNRSFFEFFKYYWDEVSTDPLILNWHIKYLCDELQVMAERVAREEPKLYDLIINISPGSTKTILVSIMFPVWVWTRWHTMRFITASYTAMLSLENAQYARDMVKSQKFQYMYPELRVRADADNKSNYRIEKIRYKRDHMNKTYKGGNRLSTSIGGSLTGFHGHFLIVDDPLNPHKAASEVELKKTNRWMKETLSTRKTNKAVTPTILVMQRLHENDPTGNMLKIRKGEKIKHISIPGEIRNYGEYLQPPELAKYYLNDLFDIHRLNWTILKELEKDLGQYGYAGQIGQNPTPPGGGMFRVENFSFVTQIATGEIEQTARYWDKAGTKDAGAYTTGVKIMKLNTGQFVVLDVKRGQWDAMKRERIILNTARADGTNCIVYHEQEPGSGGKESAQATNRNLAGFSAYADLPRGDKVYRADPFSVQVNEGNILLMQGIWNDDFIKEFESFPYGAYKDQVDAGAACFNKLAGKRSARVL